jgi:energy-coupling factor transport system ATP-binding protein
MPQAPNIIEVKGVTFSYLGETEPALRNVDLTIARGEFVLVLGPSGAGKSTLVNLFNGSVPHIFEGTLSGEVWVAGLKTTDHPVSELATVVGMVFQDPEAQLVNVLVKDEVYFGPENLLLPIEQIRENARKAVTLVGIEDLMERDVFQLSGGQKQKVAVASVLAMQPKVLVLDQPTANLDPRSTQEVFRMLRRLNQELGITIVVVEHNVDGLADMITKVIVMDRGAVVAIGSPRDVFGKRFTEFSRELGLWLPQMAELGLALQDRVVFPAIPLNAEEAFEPLLPAIQRLGAGGGWLAGEKGRNESMKSTEGEDPIIEVRDLSYVYKSNGVKALDHVSLRIYPGDFCAIVGKNGSGKSTLAKLLMKILVPDRGSVFVRGRDVNDVSLFELTQTIGYVFQNPDDQFVEDTVFDEVAYSLRVRGVREEEVEERVREVLRLFSLEKFEAVSPFSLSMGQRRLLSVATMLVVGQDVLILDEPTIGQDQSSAELLMQYLQNLNQQGKTIIIITHDMRLMSKWAGRVIAMCEGKVILDGTARQLFEDEVLVRQASLVEPPLVDLVKRFRQQFPGMPFVLTVEDFQELVMGSAEG